MKDLLYVLRALEILGEQLGDSIQFWLVVNDTEYCLVSASNREDAKRTAKPHLGADPDQYEVTPLVPKEYRFRGINFGNALIHQHLDNSPGDHAPKRTHCST